MTEKTTFDPHWSPWKAWSKSLPVAMGIPAALWLILMLIAAALEPNNLGGTLVFTVIILFYSGIVHLVAYAVVGLPLFVFGGTSDCDWMWRMPIALPLGIVAGVIPAILLISLFSGPGVFSQESWIVVLILAVYGATTGFAASRQRPPEEWPT